jgi:hypothetical protein
MGGTMIADCVICGASNSLRNVSLCWCGCYVCSSPKCQAEHGHSSTASTIEDVVIGLAAIETLDDDDCSTGDYLFQYCYKGENGHYIVDEDGLFDLKNRLASGDVLFCEVVEQWIADAIPSCISFAQLCEMRIP